MTTVDHYPGDVILDIKVLLTKETLFFIEELVDELINLFAIYIRDVF